MEPSFPSPATRFGQKPNFDVLFPPLPRTLIEVSRLIAAPLNDASLPALVRAIEFDPLTTATVLRRVNSAYFGLRQTVSDLEHAVRLLGFRDVCELVMTSAINRIDLALGTPEQEAVFRSIMRLCIGTAFYGRLLGQNLNLEAQGLAYTVSLLSNLGRLVLFYNRMNDYEALWLSQTAPEPPSSHQERVLFGVDHHALLEQAVVVWQLPEEVSEVLRHLPHPGRVSATPLRFVALAVGVAQQACQELLYPPAPPATLSMPPALHTLARHANQPAIEVRAFLADQQNQGRRFVEEMLRD